MGDDLTKAFEVIEREYGSGVLMLLQDLISASEEKINKVLEELEREDEDK